MRPLSIFIPLSILFLTIVNAEVKAQAINEFQSSNSQTIADEDGEYNDWIEIYNPLDEAVNLQGWGLSDNENNPFKWVFPDVTLSPGGYLLVWASGKNRDVPGQQLHTNFSISSAGEELLLTRPNGELVDFIPPTPVPTDISFGRVPDGTGDWYYFSQPTPGASNSTTPYEGIVPSPEFSRAGGPYTSPFMLSLESPDPEAAIRYTLTNNAPTENSGNLYSGPFQINQTNIVRARAFRDGYLPSEPVTMIYTRLGSDIQDFSTNLPVIILHEHGTPITPDDRTPASAVFFDNNQGDRTWLTGGLDFQSRVMANIRGSSSQSFPKKMYSFHLMDESDGNRDEGIFGMPPEHNWILNGPYSDKSLMRNVVAYHLAGQFGRYAPRTRFVELFFHNGNGPLTSAHYHGVYVLVERIKWGDDRVDITKIGPGDNQEPEVSGGYIIKKDRLNPGEQGMFTTRGTHLAFVRPNEQEITTAQKNWIRNYMSSFENALYSTQFTDPQEGYRPYIDVESFIDHFLITELLKEIDGYRLSTFMHKDRNGRLVMAPVWDFNLSLGNGNYLEGWKWDGWYYTLIGGGNCFWGCGVRDWYVRLLQDQNYRQQMYNRWWQLRDGIFSEEYLTDLIYDYFDELSEAQVRNFTRWPILGQYVWPNWFIAQTYEEEIDWMHNWLMNRLGWMDAQMGAPDLEPDFQLGYFWYFDNDLPNNTPLETVQATWPEGADALIEYQSALSGYPYNSGHPLWRKASMERRNRPTPLNYQPEANNGNDYDESQMRGLQVRQPFTGDAGENTMIFHLPTDGYAGIRMSFAVMDESAANELIVDYSVSVGGPDWTAAGLLDSQLSIQGSYLLHRIDFSDIVEVDDNPEFKVRFRFSGPDMSADNGDRVTFNNISLEYQYIVTSHNDDDAQLPTAMRLNQNYPNPFNPETSIKFDLPESGFTELSVYDVIGRRVAVLISDLLEAGTHQVRFDAGHLPSGVYMYTLRQGNHAQTRKMLLLK